MINRPLNSRLRFVILIVFVLCLVATALATTPKVVTLTWEYPGPALEISFNIYSALELPAEWEHRTNTAELTITLPMRAEKEFFTVRATNSITCLESL